MRARRIRCLPLFGLSLAGLIGGLGTTGTAAASGPVLPSGGVVQAGSASVGAPSGASLTVDQQSSKAIIDWSSFSIGSGGLVTFNNGSGATLNRVSGGNLSDIEGTLDATGSVYLINPAGVIVGKSGVINTGGTFVASTQDLANGQFLAGGDLTFAGTSKAAVVNYGKIGSLGGDVALIATTVENQGEIDAPKGDVGLVSGYQVVLRDQLLDSGKFQVLLGGSGTSVTNDGVIQAAEAELRANGGNVYALAGNTQSIIKATGVSTNDGKVFLIAEGGAATAQGEIDATAADGSGGQVETSGTTVNFDGLVVRAGNWLIDPYDLTVDAAAAAAIDTALNANTNVTLQTTAAGTSGPGVPNAAGVGDITIASALDWNSSALLTLDAYHGINILKPITVGGPGGVSLITNDGGSGGALSFGLTGTGFAGDIAFTGTEGTQSLTINSQVYTLLYSMAEVQAINNNLSGGYFALAAPLDASSVVGWTSIGTDGAGNALNSGNGFAGTFEGLGNSISNFTINLPSADYVGLLGLSEGTIRDIGLIGGSVTGRSGVGGLVGLNNYGIIADSYATGAVSGLYDVGGLVGANNFGLITNSYATGAVSGTDSVGGLVGGNFGTITNSYATGAVSGTDSVGGLVGGNDDTITNSYATGAVTGSGDGVGGLAGFNAFGPITNSYATGAVSGRTNVGGLVGGNFGSGTITDSYATGAVSGTTDVGGLAGFNTEGSAVINSYATGAVRGHQYVGGLVGYNNYSVITDSYATGAVTGTSATTTTVTAGNSSGRASCSGNCSVSVSSKKGITTSKITTPGSVVVIVSGNGTTTTTTTTSSSYIGGLLGYNLGSVATSWTSGAVTGTSYVGGLAGYNGTGGVFTNVYWDKGTSGRSNALGGGGLGGSTNVTAIGGNTGKSAHAQATYAGFDFGTVWAIDPGTSRPYLKAVPQQPAPQ